MLLLNSPLDKVSKKFHLDLKTMSTRIVTLSKQQTFDLQEVELLKITAPYVFVRTRQVYRFDGVLANIVNRSRVVRPEKKEAYYIEQIISAVVDAGFTGCLVWKLKLTPAAIERLNANPAEFESTMQRLVCSSAQLQLTPSLAGNYYAGSNQTDLEPEVIFRK